MIFGRIMLDKLCPRPWSKFLRNFFVAETNEFPACLQTAAVKVKSVSSCKSAYPDNFDQNTMLCAAGVSCFYLCILGNQHR